MALLSVHGVEALLLILTGHNSHANLDLVEVIGGFHLSKHVVKACSAELLHGRLSVSHVLEESLEHVKHK